MFLQSPPLRESFWSAGFPLDPVLRSGTTLYDRRHLASDPTAKDTVRTAYWRVEVTNGKGPLAFSYQSGDRVIGSNFPGIRNGRKFAVLRLTDSPPEEIP